MTPEQIKDNIVLLIPGELYLIKIDKGHIKDNLVVSIYVCNTKLQPIDNKGPRFLNIQMGAPLLHLKSVFNKCKEYKLEEYFLYKDKIINIFSYIDASGNRFYTNTFRHKIGYTKIN